VKLNKSKPIKVKEKASLKPFKSVKELDLILYWSTVLVLIMANFFMAIVIIPFILLASNFHFYLIIALLGIVFGYVFSMLVNNIENLTPHHHLIAVLFIPVFAVINLIIISTSTGGIAALLGIESKAEPLSVSLLYVASFMLPYAVSLIKKKF